MRLAALSADKARAEGRYSLVDATLVSRAGMAEDSDHTLPLDALCKLISRIAIQERRLQTQGMSIVRVQLAREAVRLAAGRRVVRENN